MGTCSTDGLLVLLEFLDLTLLHSIVVKQEGKVLHEDLFGVGIRGSEDDAAKLGAILN